MSGRTKNNHEKKRKKNRLEQLLLFVVGHQFARQSERERKGERTENGRKNRVAANSNSKPTYTEQRERRKEETKGSRGQARSKKRKVD